MVPIMFTTVTYISVDRELNMLQVKLQHCFLFCMTTLSNLQLCLEDCLLSIDFHF